MLLWTASLIGAFVLTLAPVFAQTRVFDSNPLGSQFAVGNWRQVRLTINPARQTGELMLFSNRFVWDGYSPTPRLTPQTHAVRFRSVANPRRSPVSSSPGYSPKLYDLSLVSRNTSFARLGLGARVRFAMAETPFGASRLLLLNARGEITRVIALEPSTSIRLPEPPDVFAYTTVYLAPNSVNGARFVRISGSFETGEAELALDPNTARLDDFGNPAATTRMAVNTRPVRLIERETGNNRDMRMYDIEGARMRLVVPRNGLRPARLVMLDARGRATGFQMLEMDYQSAAPLTASAWRLEQIVYNDDTIYRPEPGGAYRIQFTMDGRITGRLSANNMMGNYMVAKDRIRIIAPATTLALGPEGNIEAETLKAFGQVDMFSVRDGQLLLMLKFDSGTMIFKRETPVRR